MMTLIYKRIRKICLFVFLIFNSIINISAAEGTYDIQNKNLNINETNEIIVSLKNISGIVQAASGIIKTDSSCLQILDYEILNNSVSINSNKFVYLNILGNGISTDTNLFKIKINALKECATKIDIMEPKLTDDSGNTIANVNGGEINILKTKSNNNNLVKLVTSSGVLNPSFSSKTTSYNLTVSSIINSITVNATAEDLFARIEGKGTYDLISGKNVIKIEVFAENGDNKTYVLNVTREEKSETEKESNATLKSIIPTEGELIPAFKSDIKEYSLSLPSLSEEVQFIVSPASSKSNVQIIGNGKIKMNESKKVQIKITAENGVENIYTININREDSSSNNDLKSLLPSVGILSPEFDKDILKYVIFLPYQIDEISFEYQTEIEKSTVQMIGKNKLDIGTNHFDFIVTSENKNIKTYEVIVKRANKYLSQNLNLKSLKVENGKLLEKFDKNKYFYEYIKGINFEIVYETESDNIMVHKIENNDNVYLIVENQLGEFNIYHLKQKEKNYLLIFSIITIIELFVIIILLIKSKKKKAKLQFIKKFRR